jgi:hypothetical protein
VRRSFSGVAVAAAVAAAGLSLALATGGGAAGRVAAATTTVFTTNPGPSCNTGGLNSSGSTRLSIAGSTATASVSGWALCGEQLVVDIHWSDGSVSSNTTSASKALSGGQCIGATAYIGSSAGGVIDNPVGTWTQGSSPSQVCAPVTTTSGGGGIQPCAAPNATGRDSDGDTIDDACDPSPFPYGITSEGSWSLQLNTDVPGPTRVLSSDGTTYVPCPSGYRLKTRQYKVEWRESWLPVTFLAFTVKYAVCYQPGGAVKLAVAYPPQSPYSLVPWKWYTTSDSGFPSAVVVRNYATMQWQGSAAICAFRFGCGPTEHPGIAITFYSNNTETRSRYVG